MEENGPDIVGLGVALGIGLLIGVEREQRARKAGINATAGVRTFALIGLGGATAHLLGDVAIAVAVVFVAAAGIASYVRSSKDDPGLTTEVAMLLTVLFGILAMRSPEIAAGLGVVVAVVLASKTRLHEFVGKVLSEQELHDGLLLAASALVVLPLLPNETIDPLAAINPYKLWRLVVLVMAINALGYIGLRLLGPKSGLAVAGLTGGFVSSTATIGSMGSRARQTPKLVGAASTAGLLSNIATCVQLAIVLSAVAPALLAKLVIPIAAAGLVATAYALAFGWRGLRTSSASKDDMPGRPFQPSHALIFAGIVGAILLVGAWVHSLLGDKGIVLAATIGGFADVHAASASAGQLVGADEARLAAGVLAVVAAFSANTISKIVVAFATGGRSYGVRLLPGLLLIAGTFAAVALLT